jgi:hypothetical protein
MLSLMVTASPAFAPEAGVGLLALTDQIPGDEAVERSEWLEHMLGAHAWYVSSNIEVIAEAIAIFHQLDSGAGDTRMHLGGYAQASIRVLDALRPYYRFDGLWMDPEGDAFFDTSEEPPETNFANTVGMRWDVFTFAALKAELQRIDTATSASHRGTVQCAFTF